MDFRKVRGEQTGTRFPLATSPTAAKAHHDEGGRYIGPECRRKVKEWSDLDRPPLGDFTYEETETMLREVDTAYWKQLRGMQVGEIPNLMGLGTGERHPSPKRPLKLRRSCTLLEQAPQ